MRKIILYSILLLSVSCKKSLDPDVIDKNNDNPFTKSVEEIQGNNIPSIRIGSQVWMKYNLAETTYRNGAPITYLSYVKGDHRWSQATTGAYCYFNNDPLNKDTYGLLYNLIAVNDPQGLAPKGWHIPSNAEWETLAAYLGGNSDAGGKMKAVSALWKSPNTGATNSSRFTGLPGGYRLGTGSGSFASINYLGIWATTTHTSNNVSYYVSKLVNNNAGWANFIFSPNSGVSVRCIKD